MAQYRNGSIKSLENIQIKTPKEVSQAISSIPSEMCAGKYVIAYDQDAVFEVCSTVLFDLEVD